MPRGKRWKERWADGYWAVRGKQWFSRVRHKCVIFLNYELTRSVTILFSHRDLLRNHTEMHSVVFGVERLVVLPDPKTGIHIDKALLAATGTKEIIEVVWQNDGRLFESCVLCEEVREAMNDARVLDLATEFRTKTLDEVLGLFA